MEPINLRYIRVNEEIKTIELELAKLQAQFDGYLDANDMAGMARAKAKIKKLNDKIQSLKTTGELQQEKDEKPLSPSSLLPVAKQNANSEPDTKKNASPQKVPAPPVNSLSMLLLNSLENNSKEAASAFVEAAHSHQDLDFVNLGERLSAFAKLNQQEKQKEAESIVNELLRLSKASENGSNGSGLEAAMQDDMVREAWQAIVSEIENLETISKLTKNEDQNSHIKFISTARPPELVKKEPNPGEIEKPIPPKESGNSIRGELSKFLKFWTKPEEFFDAEQENQKKKEP